MKVQNSSLVPAISRLVLEKLGKVYTYSHMRYDQDTTNSFYQGLDDRAKNLYAQAQVAFAYIVPELLSVDESKIAQFLEEKEELRLYEHALEEINLQRPHVLSADRRSVISTSIRSNGCIK